MVQASELFYMHEPRLHGGGAGCCGAVCALMCLLYCVPRIWYLERALVREGKEYTTSFFVREGPVLLEAAAVTESGR